MENSTEGILFANCSNDTAFNDTVGNGTSCVAPRRAYCYDLETTPDWMIYVHAVCVCFLMVTSIVANLLVIILVAKYKRLRVRSTIMTLSVVIADLLMVFSLHFPAFSSLISLSFPFTHEGCLTFGFLARNAIVTRWTIMGMLSIERLFAVRFPFFYKKHGKIVIAVLFLIGWVAPAILSGVAVLLKAQGVFRVDFPTCIISCPQVVGQTVCKLFGNISLAIFIGIGSILPVLIYIYLYFIGRRIKRNTRVLGEFDIPAGDSKPEIDKFDVEYRASITFLIIFATVFVTSVPFDISIIVAFISIPVWCSAPLFVHFVTIAILISATSMDPIFILRDSDFRWCLKDLFCCGKNQTVDFVTSEDFVASGRRPSVFSDNYLHVRKKEECLHAMELENVALRDIKTIGESATISESGSSPKDSDIILVKDEHSSSQAGSDDVQRVHICTGSSPE